MNITIYYASKGQLTVFYKEIIKEIDVLQPGIKKEENDEKLWQIMSRLEDLKRDYADISELDNPANLTFQKRLAEIKAALLPLLTTIGTTSTNVPDEEVEIEVYKYCYNIFGNLIYFFMFRTNWPSLMMTFN